jgi:hypothetical protein
MESAEIKLLGELERTQQAYAADLESKPLAEANKHKDAIRRLRKQISDNVSKNARKCSKCGAPPLGIFHPDPSGIELKKKRQRQLLKYEIRCVPCIRATGDEKFSARSTSHAAAVAEWNAAHAGKE